jgi:hypothetical protein
MVIDYSKSLRPYARVLVYGAGSDVLTWTSDHGGAGPSGPPGGPGAREVTTTRAADIATLA